MNRDPNIHKIEPAKGGDEGLCELLNEIITVLNAVALENGPLGFGGGGGGNGIVNVYATVINDNGTVTLNPVAFENATVGAPVSAADL